MRAIFRPPRRGDHQHCLRIDAEFALGLVARARAHDGFGERRHQDVALRRYAAAADGDVLRRIAQVDREVADRGAVPEDVIGVIEDQHRRVLRGVRERQQRHHVFAVRVQNDEVKILRDFAEGAWPIQAARRGGGLIARRACRRSCGTPRARNPALGRDAASAPRCARASASASTHLHSILVCPPTAETCVQICRMRLNSVFAGAFSMRVSMARPIVFSTFSARGLQKMPQWFCVAMWRGDGAMRRRRCVLALRQISLGARE